MTNPNHPHSTADREAAAPINQPAPSPFARILLLILITAGAAISGICPDLMSASVFAAITAGLFSYTFLLTF